VSVAGTALQPVETTVTSWVEAFAIGDAGGSAGTGSGPGAAPVGLDEHPTIAKIATTTSALRIGHVS
jgi:hypothetical protein